MTAPIIILVRPQLVENIGSAARAMLNCELTQLRIVDPRDPWPSQEGKEPMEPWIRERLYASASGADEILNNAKVFPDLRTALADLNHVYATSARDHDMAKRWLTPREAVAAMLPLAAEGQKTGIMFGPERTGLTHDDMTFANEAIYIPVNPQFSSLNLAQAVLILSYEWHEAQNKPPKPRQEPNRAATKDELHNFFDRLEGALDEAGFFTTPELRPTMVRNLRHAVQRAAMTEQEIRTWHGVVKALAEGPKRKKDIQ